MGVFIVIACAVMVAMVCIGLSMAFDWDLEPRIVGMCTTAWAAVALYLFIFQWLPLREPSAYSLAAITFLSTAGYIVGQTIASLLRKDWLEDLVPSHGATTPVKPRPHRKRTAKVIQLEIQRS